MHVQKLAAAAEVNRSPHSKHSAAPLLGLYLPGSQAAHVSAVSRHPATHVQLSVDALNTCPARMHSQLPVAARNCLRPIQSVHACGPAWNLYMPGAHAAHAPAAPVQSGMHEQSAGATLPCADTECWGQGAQSILPLVE